MDVIGDRRELVERARSLLAGGRRRILGITGAPGAGKSTVAGELCAELGPELSVLVPMDGFHLADRELLRIGRRDRKGALDTFDGAGFLALLRRVRAADEPVVYAPEFRREIEDAVAGSIAVRRDVPLVVCEGNYLLVDEEPWASVRALLDEAWFVEVDEERRIERLVARHVAFGKPPDLARTWSLGTDQINASIIGPTRARADVALRLG